MIRRGTDEEFPVAEADSEHAQQAREEAVAGGVQAGDFMVEIPNLVGSRDQGRGRGGVERRHVAALHRQQIRLREAQQDLQRRLQAQRCRD